MAVEEPLLPPAPSRRRLVAPLAAVAIVLALLVGGGIAAFVVSQSASSDAPPEAAPFVTPGPALPVAIFDVREANGAEVTLLPANIEADAFTATLPPGVALEALIPGTPDQLEAGQWLVFVGERDPVRNYVIRQVIAIREPVEQRDGPARSPAGFTGAELVTDPAWRTVLWGAIESVTYYPQDGGANVTLAGPDGPIDVQILAGVPLVFVGPYEAAITDGDRIATRAPAGTSPAGAGAILVSPQGAR